MRQIILFLATMLFCCCSAGSEAKAQTTMDKMYITIGEQTQRVTLVDNDATRELVTALQDASITVTLNDNNFEIWGSLCRSLTTKNEQMTAQAGDIVLYNGSNICIFYDSNSWSYTRLGKIDGLSEDELRTFLKAGQNDIQVTLSLSKPTGINTVKSDGYGSILQCSNQLACGVIIDQCYALCLSTDGDIHFLFHILCIYIAVRRTTAEQHCC